MKGISRDEKFIPTGCEAPPHDAVTIAAGEQWSAVYQFADVNKIIIIGGDSPNVGAAGGWVQGAGHSILSQAHGLGVDNVLQAKIVTADGVERTINECQYSDLFWRVYVISVYDRRSSSLGFSGLSGVVDPVHGVLSRASPTRPTLPSHAPGFQLQTTPRASRRIMS
jgi:FAD/FMN-containing dehydrogenase